MKITYTSILSAICSSILLLGFLSVYIWKKQENYSLYEVKLLIFCTVLTGVRLFFPIDICGISHTIGIKILYPELCRFMRGKIGFLSHFSVLFLISLLGSFLILVQKSLSYISFIKLIKEIRPIEYIRVKKYKKVKKIPILKVDSIEDPFNVGIKNPYIIIPNIDEETKKIVLLHEVGHYIKRDLFLKCFFEILCLLYWWNPLVYIVRYYFSNILEIRNDLIVCNELSEIEKIHYVEILLKMSRTKALKRRGTLSFFNGSFLKIRISSILNEEQKKQVKKMKKTIRILAVIIAMTCIFSGTAFAQEKEVAVEKSSSIARADVIKYVYKVENGKLYRRLYNYSKDTWLGDWELCD